MARQLAEMVLTQDAEDCIVCALTGPPGSGKTSLLNLTKYYIREAQAAGKPVRIVVFDPWHYASPLAIARGCLVSLAQAVQEENQQLAQLLLEYAGMVTGDGSPGEGGRTADALYERLSSEFRGMDGRTVVLMDDIDRLGTSEAQKVLWLVGLGARLPRVSHLLSFDAKCLYWILHSESPHQVQAWLQSAIQVEFKVQAVGRTIISDLLAQELADVMQSVIVDTDQEERWRGFLGLGLDSLFQNLRDVKRFCNTVDIDFGLVAGEVNPADFLVLEVIKTFMPSAYDALAARRMLVAGSSESHAYRIEKSALREEAEQIVGCAPAARHNLLRSVLRRLFPRVDNAYGGPTTAFEDEVAWRTQMRVCSYDFLDVYFELGLAPGSVPVSAVTSLIAAADDYDKASKLLDQHIQGGSIRAYIERLMDIAPDFEDEPVGLVRALTDAGNRVQATDASIGRRDTQELLTAYVCDVLEQIGPERRLEVLAEALRTTPALGFACRLLRHLEGLAQEEETAPLLTEDELTSLRATLVQRLQSADMEGLLAPGRGSLVLYALRAWNVLELVQPYLGPLIETPDGLVRAARILSREVQTPAVGPTGPVMRQLDVNLLSQVYDLDVLHAKATQFYEQAALDPEARGIIQWLLQHLTETVRAQARRTTKEDTR